MEYGNRKGVIFARYLWLYGEIAGKGPISYEMINEHWMDSSLNEDHAPLPHKTFENHRRAVEDMFGIIIECDRTNNTYFIEQGVEPDFSRAAMEMLNGALLFNRLQTNPKMRQFIRPEQNGEDSSMVFIVTEALEESRELKMRYRHNYDPKREREYRVKPIAVKQFHCRWYIIAELPDGSTYSFPLDRVLNLSKGDKVKPSVLNVDDLFKDSYGIIRESDVPVERIRLKVEREQANYFLSKPLHESQKVLDQTDEFVVFSLSLSPTYDFIMEILSHGAKVEVLGPQSFRELIASKVSEMSNLYK